MIRRDEKLADGSPAWVLISQIDHAHLAAELAVGWCEGQAMEGWLDVIVPTIARHDDGWREWQRAPTIDPGNGRPRSFLEMPAPLAHEIWRRSIDGVAELGPLAQFMVAEHFCRLRRAAGLSDDPAVQAFLAEFAERCRDWLEAWRAESPARNTPAVAKLAVAWLQFFDVFSLWLCMAERETPHELSLPGGAKLTLTPAAESGARRIVVRPWPWNEPQRELHVAGRQLAATRFCDDTALQAALAAAPCVGLNWLLVA